MKNFYLITVLCLILSGCGPSRLDFREEPLTREKYCVASNKLIPVKNSTEADFTLRYTKDDSLKQAPLKASLHISQNGREYNINSSELLSLIVDGDSYNLPIAHSSQIPLEVADYNTVAVGAGTMRFGSVSEVTRRKMAFYISVDYLKKILAAKRVTFEISLPSSDSKGYPILLDLNSESITFLKEFEQKCVNSFPN
jgi:hypothetical protein